MTPRHQHTTQLEPGTIRRQKVVAGVEVLLGISIIFGNIWYIHRLHGTLLRIVSISVIVALFLLARHRSGETWQEVGFRWDNLLVSTRIVLPFTIIAVLLLGVVWQVFFPLDLSFYRHPDFWIRLLEYPAWALLQQTVAQVFFFRRFRTIARPLAWPAVLASGMLFSAIHIPNPPLLIFTFVSGIAWSWTYLKHPNVFTLAVSHSILGVACSCVFLMYGSIGPFADMRWSNIQPISYRIETINGEMADKDRTLYVSKNENEKLVVVGWVKGVRDEVEEVFVRFDGVNYPAAYGLEREDIETLYGDPSYRHTGFRVQIPISECQSGYYILLLRIQLRGKRLHHRPSKRFWIRIE